MSRYCILVITLLFQLNLYPQNIDIRLLRAINSPAPLPSDGFFRFVSGSNDYVIAAASLSLGITGLARKDPQMKKAAFEMLVSQAVTLGVSQGLKYTVKRERPFDRYNDIFQKTDVHDPSFPSGHTSAAFGAATSLSLSYPKWYVIVPSYAWASTVAYSRLDLGVHYPSDVIAGALIGSGCAWLTHFVNKKLHSGN